jgi:hypothetical protein
MTTNLSDYIQRLRDALTSIDPFSHTVQGDDYCLWCRRDRPRDAKDFADLSNPEHHDADCEYILALAEPVPLALHDAQVLREAADEEERISHDPTASEGYNLGRSDAAQLLRAKADALVREGGINMTGAQLILRERARQMIDEGWTLEHDDAHVGGELSKAAGCYVEAARKQILGASFSRLIAPTPEMWPWEPRWWKPSGGAARNLVKAGALIAAEIDRVGREAEARKGVAPDETVD